MFKHILAWLRGDLEDITSVFEKAYAKLSAHVDYKSAVINEHHAAIADLQSSAEAHAADRAKAIAIRANIGQLLGK